MAFFEDNSISHDITTDAAFRAWAQMIHDGFEAVGLVQTADTGQIDLVTVATPGSNGTYAGYEIWRFDDADQATEPIYFKFEYGRGGGANFTALRTSVGLGSNGSGTLTTASAFNASACAVTPSGNGLIHIAFVDGCLGIVSWNNTTNASVTSVIIFRVERVKTADTNALQGAILTSGSQFNDPMTTTHIFSDGAWRNSQPQSVISGSVSYGGVVTPGFYRCGSPVSSSPSLSFVPMRTGVVGTGDTGIINIRGVDRTYKKLGFVSSSSINEVAQNVTNDLLAIHE